ncbi:efflux RND transporter periplasmic adaptor subunit [Acinetobacter tandoii]|uniref:efflux RND transporter periplasmic adaptor subunit n=1 Tax=Acinetobacter tandoii TaxID=202954 RepID=UPI000C208896|nr:efflux RND transporter periplasmic adaptor subunit [Acinetobacter tandoii]
MNTRIGKVKTKRSLLAIMLMGSVAALGLSGCGEQTAEQTKGTEAAQLPEVNVMLVKPQVVENNVELAGRVNPYEISEVRPQIRGIILKQLFKEGSYVKKGQPLFEVDSRSYRADTSNAQAAVNRSQANLAVLQTKLNRYQQLVNIDAVSRQEYDDLVAQVKLAQADVQASQANLQNTRINLDYTVIKAPISGKIGRSRFTVGALVTENQAEPLAVIHKLDPIYVDINQSSAELLRLKSQLETGEMSASSSRNVSLRLEDGSTYPIQGQLTLSEVAVDPNSGTLTLRSTFQNPNNVLLPGMFVTGVISQASYNNAFLVPLSAVMREPTGDAFVYILNKDNVVTQVKVNAVASMNNQWIVTEGLKDQDRVILQGVAKVKPGTQANAKVLQEPLKNTPDALAAPVNKE